MTAQIAESECGKHLRFCARARNECKWLLMLQACCDDSGTHGGPYCFLAGYLAHVERWAAFSDHWNHLLQKYLGGRPLRMASANRLKDPGHVPVQGLVEFAQCIVEHVDFEISAVLPEYHAKQIQEQYGFAFDGYRICFLGLLEAVINDYRVRALDDTLVWTFDHQGRGNPDEASKLEMSLHRAFNDARSAAPSDLQPILAGLSFMDDKFWVPLQAADFLVWHKRRFHSTGIDAETHPAYEVLKEANLKRIEVVWFNHKLEDLLDRITKPK